MLPESPLGCVLTRLVHASNERTVPGFSDSYRPDCSHGREKAQGNYVGGARELLGVVLIIGLARWIVVIMEQGLIADTILHSAEQSLGGLPELAFINLRFWIEVGMSFFAPSSSGLAVLSIPILAPLADFAGVGRDPARSA